MIIETTIFCINLENEVSPFEKFSGFITAFNKEYAKAKSITTPSITYTLVTILLIVSCSVENTSIVAIATKISYNQSIMLYTQPSKVNNIEKNVVIIY